MAADPTINSETMQFRDHQPGSMDERGAYSDSTRDLAMVQDVGLSDFFSRPIKIAEFQWDVDSPIFERINPWTLFWENARNLEKIRNYYLLRSKLHVKLLINGNAFYFGRVLAAYEPLSPIDNTSPRRTWVPQDFIRGSQRMHVFLNPTSSLGGSLELPFFYPKNNWRVPYNEWKEMGEIVIASINDLKHANGGINPLNITVLAWAEDVKFAIPTRLPPGEEVITTPEAGMSSDEHNVDVISRPASNMARIAGALSNVPVIGPYAKATQVGASGIARIAKIFGYSAPNNLEYELIEPRAKHSLAVTDTKQSAHKVTVDSKQELTIDPRTTGIRADDELPIASIAGRESYLTTFNWDLTDDPDLHLFNIRVDPGLIGRNGSEWHFTAPAFACLPFQYWRGTMRFRFQVVSSEYHKGRLRIAYDPAQGANTTEFNTNYTTIHDISECKDFTVDVGWGQETPYRRSYAWNVGSEYGTIPLTLNQQYGNGVLSVYVLNKLTAPGTSVDPIQINVFVSMLEDFEVAAPDESITFLKFKEPVAPPPPVSFADVITTPEAGVSDDADCGQDAPITDPESIDSMADGSLDDPLTTKVFMGEVVPSFRSLLKRTYKSDIRLMPETDSTSMISYSLSSFPTVGGFYEGQTPLEGSVLLTFQDGRFYNPSITTLMNYLSRAFLGWRGSTRWTVDTSGVNVAGSTQGGSSELFNSISYSFSRKNDYTNSRTITSTEALNINSVAQSFNNATRGQSTRGLALGNTNVNPVQTVEVPYMENKRFSYTFLEDNYSSVNRGPGWDFSLIYPKGGDTLTQNTLTFYVSGGEDFNFFFFNGLPPVYFEAEYQPDQAG